MIRAARSRPRRQRLAMLIALCACLLPSAVCPTIARAANLAVSNEGDVVEIQPSGVRQSSARPPSREAGRLRVAEYVGTQYHPPAGGSRAESVIGSDDRTQVADTTIFPNSAIAQLEMTFPSNQIFTCTAWMIDADRLATAGHCIYDSFNGGFAESITVYPGRNGDTAPFGSLSATKWYVPDKWKRTEKMRFDYGVIKLGSNIGDTVGFFGFAAEEPSFLNKRKIKVRGYPADKPVSTMWTMNGKIKEVTSSQLFYKLDTSGGQSGSPIFGSKAGCDPCSFGIHAYATPPPPAAQRNSGTRITSPIFDFLMQTGAN